MRILCSMFWSLSITASGAVLPAWLAPYPGSSETGSYMVAAPVATVIKHYRSELKDASVSVSEAGIEDGGTVLRATKDYTSCVVRITADIETRKTKVGIICAEDRPAAPRALDPAPQQQQAPSAPPSERHLIAPSLESLQKIVSLRVIDKGFRPVDTSQQRYQADITFTAYYQSLCEKGHPGFYRSRSVSGSFRPADIRPQSHDFRASG